MTNKTATQCECKTKAIIFTSSFAYCEKCRRRIRSEEVKHLLEPMTTLAILPQKSEFSESAAAAYKVEPTKRRTGYGIY